MFGWLRCDGAGPERRPAPVLPTPVAAHAPKEEHLRTTVRRAGWMAAAAATILVTGCGSGTGAEPSAPVTAASSVPFGQKDVQADLDAASAAAGLPRGRTKGWVSSAA
ncbi:hypothetical protein GCM10010377_74580 [Streptomyces viridiviolaceus]|nr:hypothetical protein GCM10010377_74580 [Streptomyces viridiviolaceus]